MHTVWPVIWQETLKIVENEKWSLWDLENDMYTKNHGKCETHTVGPGIRWETLKIEENEKCTL